MSVQRARRYGAVMLALFFRAGRLALESARLPESDSRKRHYALCAAREERRLARLRRRYQREVAR